MSTADLQSAVDWTAAFGQLVMMWALVIVMAIIIIALLLLAVVAIVKAWREAA